MAHLLHTVGLGKEAGPPCWLRGLRADGRRQQQEKAQPPQTHPTECKEKTVGALGCQAQKDVAEKPTSRQGNRFYKMPFLVGYGVGPGLYKLIALPRPQDYGSIGPGAAAGTKKAEAALGHEATDQTLHLLAQHCVPPPHPPGQSVVLEPWAPEWRVLLSLGRGLDMGGPRRTAQETPGYSPAQGP